MGIMKEQYMVYTGSLSTGFKFYGPFDDANYVYQWATVNLEGLIWTIVVLISPQQ